MDYNNWASYQMDIVRTPLGIVAIALGLCAALGCGKGAEKNEFAGRIKAELTEEPLELVYAIDSWKPVSEESPEILQELVIGGMITPAYEVLNSDDSYVIRKWAGRCAKSS